MTIKTKTTAIKRQLAKLIVKNDQKQTQLVDLRATQLSIYHHAKMDIEKTGLTIETKATTKTNPAINIAHNSCSQAMGLPGAVCRSGFGRAVSSVDCGVASAAITIKKIAVFHGKFARSSLHQSSTRPLFRPRFRLG
jgi:hypothetical protein